MASTSLQGNPCHVRSISLPSRSHPLSVRVEEGLHKLNAWATSSLPRAASPTSELLRVGLQALEEMYDCVEELLRLPQARRALARQQHEMWAAKELESSVRLLDICGSTRDAVSSMKEEARALQSALRTRRSGGEYSSINVEGKIRAFVHSRKKAHEDSRKCMKTLKQIMEAGHHASPISAADDDDLSLPLKAFTDLREIAIIIFRHISASLSKPSRRWFPTSRTSEAEQISTGELQEVETSLRSIHGSKRSGRDAGTDQKVEEAQKGLQRLEVGMGALETCLESMFRRLIKNRVSLLNILSL